jgi:hypothetical protein
MYPNNQKTYSKKWITVFVIVWTLVFHYESIRYFYLEPLVGHQLPKLKFLFPPAGWIMFYNVDEGYGLAEVFGVRHGNPEFIDPHRIFETKAVLYDNIHRNVLSGVLSSYYGPEFCRFLKRKFPEFENFYVTAVYYPSVIKTPDKKLYQLKYVCQ